MVFHVLLLGLLPSALAAAAAGECGAADCSETRASSLIQSRMTHGSANVSEEEEEAESPTKGASSAAALASRAPSPRAVLVFPGAECQSDDDRLGSWWQGFETVEACMQAVVEKGGQYFSYGTAGWKTHHCKIERTTNHQCFEGWEDDDYDFYRIDYGVPLPSPQEPLEIAMAKVADGVYHSINPSGGWTMALEKIHEKDHMAVYERGDQCALAFSGTNNKRDWLSNFNVQLGAACGSQKVHMGVVEELWDLLTLPEWESDFVPLLLGKTGKCSGGVILVGHSLGGMMASVFAACANRRFGGGIEQDSWGKKVRIPFRASMLYTYGAAGVSETPLTNGQAKDGCFQGGRFFNLDSKTFDAVPVAAFAVDLVHPRVQAIQMHSDDDEVLTKKTYSCVRADRPALQPVDVGALFPSIPDHKSENYALRTMALFK